MTYGYIKVKCPRCESNIEIINSGISTDLFYCPVCAEGEIYYKSNQRMLQPVPVNHQNNPRLEQYVTTLSNIWIN